MIGDDVNDAGYRTGVTAGIGAVAARVMEWFYARFGHALSEGTYDAPCDGFGGFGACRLHDR
jgi:hypothetical protein